MAGLGWNLWTLQLWDKNSSAVSGFLLPLGSLPPTHASTSLSKFSAQPFKPQRQIRGRGYLPWIGWEWGWRAGEGKEGLVVKSQDPLVLHLL